MVNKRIYTYLFSLLFFMSIYSVYSQRKSNVSWYLEDKGAIETINVISGEHLLYYKDHVDTLVPYAIQWHSEHTQLAPKAHLFEIKGKLIAVFDGTGKVFEVDSSEQVIRRLDNTYHHGYNYGNYTFSRKDTIYAWSGYGFWATSVALTYYAESRKEWNLYTKNPSVFPQDEKDRSNIIAFYDKKHDKLYAWGNKNFFDFDFKTQIWTDHGQLTKEIYGMNHMLSDTSFLCFNGEEALEIYPCSNQMLDVTLLNKANTNTYYRFRNWLNCAYNVEAQLLIPKYTDKVHTGVIFEYVPKFTRTSRDPIPIYETPKISSWITFYLAIGTLVLLLFVFIFALRRRYRNRRSKIFALEQWRLIDELMEHDLNTDELNVILEIDDKSWETQRRKRSDAIKEINNLGMKQFEQEIVLRIRNSEDKRQVLYRMNPLVKAELARLM